MHGNSCCTSSTIIFPFPPIIFFLFDVAVAVAVVREEALATATATRTAQICILSAVHTSFVLEGLPLLCHVKVLGIVAKRLQ